MYKEIQVNSNLNIIWQFYNWVIRQVKNPQCRWNQRDDGWILGEA